MARARLKAPKRGKIASAAIARSDGGKNALSV